MKKFTTAERLNQIMNERNMKQVDIIEACKPYCKKYGIKLEKSDLSQYVSGKVTPGQDKLTILGLALDVNEVWLMGYDVLPSKYAIQCAKEATTNTQCELIARCDSEVRDMASMVIRLDDSDRGEIRGEMKQMLKADKYRKKDGESGARAG